ncbi:unnamed protein product, partial [Mesorhabditis belari]|uniref:Uncharacterized protein n=1 Tax=Mesorhabditis belari TaxID=2138241 RepID=A0AAF3F9Y3_9BILA
MLVKRGQMSNLLGNESHPRVSLEHFDEFIRDDYVPEFIKMEKELFDDHGTNGSSINASTMAYIGGTAVGVIIAVALIGFALLKLRKISQMMRFKHSLRTKLWMIFLAITISGIIFFISQSQRDRASDSMAPSKKNSIRLAEAQSFVHQMKVPKFRGKYCWNGECFVVSDLWRNTAPDHRARVGALT